MLDGYAALAGVANAHTTGASAHNATCTFEGASVPGVVARLWDAAGPADATPARGYLSRRGCWPGRHVRAPLPESVRWLAREAAPERDEAAGWHGLDSRPVLSAPWCSLGAAPACSTARPSRP